MTVDLNIFNLWRQPSDPSNQPIDINLIQGLPNKHFEDKYTESNFGHTDQGFEKFFSEEMMLLEELYQTTNHVSSTRWKSCPKPLSVEPRNQLCPSI